MVQIWKFQVEEYEPYEYEVFRPLLPSAAVWDASVPCSKTAGCAATETGMLFRRRRRGFRKYRTWASRWPSSCVTHLGWACIHIAGSGLKSAEEDPCALPHNKWRCRQAIASKGPRFGRQSITSAPTDEGVESITWIQNFESKRIRPSLLP